MRYAERTHIPKNQQSIIPTATNGSTPKKKYDEEKDNIHKMKS